jgi:hypothetical protein
MAYSGWHGYAPFLSNRAKKTTPPISPCLVLQLASKSGLCRCKTCRFTGVISIYVTLNLAINKLHLCYGLMP